MKKPAIIIIHGDKFYDGSKDDKVYEALMLDYASQGYVALSVDYRLFREARIPALHRGCEMCRALAEGKR